MQPTSLEADYLVIGSGAVGMAFVDVLLAETDASVVLVDRHHRPGGHWNDAYSFVRLHSPAAYYGVASTPLGSGQLETSGGNAGLLDLASGRALSAYYDQVLEQKLLPTGRLRYFPMCDYRGDGEFVSLLSGQRTRVTVRKKLVDATFTRTEVPSTHAPKYTLADDVRCLAINDLVRVATPAQRYVVIGAGKTGIDACLWLLERDVPPASIRWIRPRDTWLHNRARLQPATIGPMLMESGASQMEEAVRASSLDDLFLRLEARGELLRIDGQVMPSMFRGATVSEAELVQLRRIEDVVRLGRVQRIELDRIELEQGSVATSPDTLHIDCSADGIALCQERRPVFEPRRITPQPIRYCHPTLSGALIGHLEARAPHDIERNNALARPLPYPTAPRDWARLTLANAANSQLAAQDEELRSWESRCRLNPMFGAPAKDLSTPAWEEARRRYRANVQSGMARLRELLTSA